MMRDVSIPLAADDPVAVALNDPAIRARLRNAARAFLLKRGAEFSSTERTAEVEAITQEAAARAWEHRGRFDASREIVKWLVGFVINVSREFAKKRSRDRISPTEDAPDLESRAVDPARAL